MPSNLEVPTGTSNLESGATRILLERRSPGDHRDPCGDGIPCSNPEPASIANLETGATASLLGAGPQLRHLANLGSDSEPESGAHGAPQSGGLRLLDRQALSSSHHTQRSA